MPHFAEINPQTGEVLRVIVAISKLWCEYHLDGTWVKAFKNVPGKNYPSIGYIYHTNKDNFSMPQPHPSWNLDENCIWQPPIIRPNDANFKDYEWNEETQNWDETDS